MRPASFLLLPLLGCSPHGTERPPRQTVALPPPAPTSGAVEAASAAASEPDAGQRPSARRKEPCYPYEECGAGPPFDRGATATALGYVDLAPCRTPGAVRGSGHLRILFANDGSVATTRVDRPPFEGTATGDCIAAQFARVHIPPFVGDAVTVGKAFDL